MADSVLHISPRITALPVIHGSGDFALEVRRVMLAGKFDCVAVPLPESFREQVEKGIEFLPIPTLVTQEEPAVYRASWTPEDDADDDTDDDDERRFNYVPIDPCQAVIMALRVALGERIPRAYVDLETARFEPHAAALPDPYALKKVPLERFAAALLPVIGRPEQEQRSARIVYMAQRLRGLEKRHKSILFVCSVLDWPWIREAYVEERPALAEPDEVAQTCIYQADPRTLLFMLGELPFVTGLYERARAELEDDENLSIDGVKELLLAARESYRADLKRRARKLTPHLLSQLLKYVRNLSLIERRFTPDLYTLVIGAQQVAGDQYALHVAETVREYPYTGETPFDVIALGVDQGRLPDGDVVTLKNRLSGPPCTWRSLELKRRPAKSEVEEWQMRWNPFSQCSWPPEDEKIEDFRSHVFDRAKELMGIDLVHTEKFTTSIRDGIDIRETLRHFYEGEIYVKVLPPSRGYLDCAVMLFDSPADPRDYPWRSTWFAEHEQESTLAFFATDFTKEMVGPGICLATYGGAMMIFPPVSIRDIWRDRRLDFTETLEERLLAAACIHSSCPQIALLSPLPPGPGWRRLAKRFSKSWVHVPLGQFSDSTVQQLRMLHVLNGRQVRSYAAEFIRKA